MQGKELVSTIQAVLEVQTRGEQRDLVQKMTIAAEKILENSGIEKHSGDFFDFFRGLDKKENFSSEKQSLEVRRGFIALKLRDLGISDLEIAAKLGDQLDEAYALLRRDLFRSRSRSAYVGAVLRPFRQKYLDLWAEALGDDFNRGWVLDEVKRLNEFQVDSEVDLYVWSDAVFNLFQKVAVIGRPEKDAQPGGFKKPLGMIGPSSEKTYKQQWELWMKRNSVGLLTGNFKYNTPSYGSRFDDRPPMQTRYRSDYEELPLRFENPASESSPQNEVPKQESPSDGVTLKLECVGKENVTAERTWLTRQTAISEIESWISSIGLFWGGDDVEISMELELSTLSGESRFTVPPMSLGKAGQTVVKALANYK